MTAKIGSTTNTNDTVQMSGPIVIDDLASDEILAAQVPGAPPRIKVVVSNTGIKAAFIKFEAASASLVEEGIFLDKLTTMTILEHPNVYPGPISALAVNGSTVINVVNL